jgi:hypothetical protein
MRRTRDIEAMGKKVAAALALQGRSNSLAAEIDGVTSAINRHDSEIARLKSLIPVREAAQNKLTGLEKEAASVNASLEEALSAMKAEGIELPLGSKAQVRTGRL